MQRRHFLGSGLLAGVGAIGVLPAILGSAHSATGEPGLNQIDGWLNTEAAVDLAALRGKVTLVNFWTYSCINALRTLPYLSRWHEEYGPSGLQVLGIHTPEFSFEHLRQNVGDAVRQLGIRYPVGQDNSYRTWRAWSNRAWPAFYLLNQDGRVVMLREGEGHSVELEQAIRSLLDLPGRPSRDPPDDADLSRVRSPEVYFSTRRPTSQEAAQSPRRGEETYTFGQSGPRLNRYELDGRWMRDEEALILRSDRGRVRVHYSAAKVHVVAAATNAAPVQVRSVGGAWRSVQIGRPALYTVVDDDSYAEQIVEIEAMSPGLALYSATFG